MQRIITYTILSGDSETSVLSFLRKNGFSKHILTTMKRAEHAILLNGHPVFGRTVLKEGDVLRILVPEENGAADNGSAASIIPVQLPLDILYEDEDILVLNKPADMPVHPSAGNYENTLANGVAWYYKQQGENFVYRCINRLEPGYYRSSCPGKKSLKWRTSVCSDETASDPPHLSGAYRWNSTGKWNCFCSHCTNG